VRIKALIIAGLLALGVVGAGSAGAQEITICYDYNLVIADQVNEQGSDCIVLPPA